MKKVLLLLACITLYAKGNTLSTTMSYIETYKELAIREMRRTGIPASITLAQGLLESDRGKSDLAKDANNHFGVKSYNWSGVVYKYKKDKNLYRRYESVTESYIDHSEFLLRPRYALLFTLDPTDFKGWARGLKRYGYAEDKNYAQKLIGVIETYNLYELDVSILPRIEPPVFILTNSAAK